MYADLKLMFRAKEEISEERWWWSKRRVGLKKRKEGNYLRPKVPEGKMYLQKVAERKRRKIQSRSC